jgi:hypothetical protein
MTADTALILVSEYLGHSMTLFSLYVSVVSAYLIIAYLVGQKLLKSQAIIITLLFVGFALFMTVSSYKLLVSAHIYLTNYGNNEKDIIMYVYALTSMELLGIIAALKFMFDIRKAKERKLA